MILEIHSTKAALARFSTLIYATLKYQGAIQD